MYAYALDLSDASGVTCLSVCVESVFDSDEQI